MRILFLVMLFFILAINCFGQLSRDSNQLKPDSTNAPQPGSDSIVNDSGNITIDADSIATDSNRVSAARPSKTYQSALNELLKKNKLINLTQKPVSLKSNKEKHHNKEYLFYLLGSILLIFGFFKVFYATYFNNIFRVFFNTSLRQNQLTDLLLQAKLLLILYKV